MRPEIRAYDPPVDSHVTVSTQGHVTPGEIGYAREKIAAALRPAARRVLFVRARLTNVADPAAGRPASVHVTVDLRGRPLQVTSAGVTMHEAIDLAHDRLRGQLRRLASQRLAARHRPAPQGEDEPA